MFIEYDIIVAGAGHAGSEAAAEGPTMTGKRVYRVVAHTRLGGARQVYLIPRKGYSYKRGKTGRAKMTAPEVEIKRLSTVGNHLSATVTARELRGRDAQIELDFTDTSVSGSAKVPLIGTVTRIEGTKIAE